MDKNPIRTLETVYDVISAWAEDKNQSLETVYEDESGELFQFDPAEAKRWDDPASRHPFFRLYRLLNGQWILCWDKRDYGHVETRFQEMTPENATDWFLSRGICLPEELKHLGEAKRLDKQPSPGIEKRNASYWQRFGPIHDDSTGDQRTLMYHPPDHWILFTEPSYRAAGNRHKPLTRDEAAKWLLDNGFDVPPILIPHLPAPESPNDEQLLEPQTSPTNDQPGDDPTAFRPAKEFLSDRFPDFKAIHKALKDSGCIRWRKPSRQRLEIHAGDWQKYLIEISQTAPDSLDLPANVVDEVLEIERRKEKERASRARS